MILQLEGRGKDTKRKAREEKTLGASSIFHFLICDLLISPLAHRDSSPNTSPAHLTVPTVRMSRIFQTPAFISLISAVISPFGDLQKRSAFYQLNLYSLI